MKLEYSILLPDDICCSLQSFSAIALKTKKLWRKLRHSYMFVSTFRAYFNLTSRYGVLGTAPKLELREEIEFVPVFTSSKQRRKRKFYVVFVQVVKKSALHVQNWARFVWRSHCRRLCRCSKNLSMCVNGWKSEHVFSKNACHLFTRSMCHSRFSPLMKNNFVSLETDNPAESWMIWGKLCS